jgi:hypothetical protein
MQINRYELFGGKLFFKNKWFPVLLAVFLILDMIDQIIRMAQGTSLILFVGVALEIAMLVYLFKSNPFFLTFFNIWFLLTVVEAVWTILMIYSRTKTNPEDALNMIFPITFLVIATLLAFGKDKFAYIKDKGFNRPNSGS